MAKAILVHVYDPPRISPGLHCLDLTILEAPSASREDLGPLMHSVHQRPHQNSMLPLQIKLQYKAPHSYPLQLDCHPEIFLYGKSGAPLTLFFFLLYFYVILFDFYLFILFWYH